MLPESPGESQGEGLSMTGIRPTGTTANGGLRGYGQFSKSLCFPARRTSLGSSLLALEFVLVVFRITADCDLHHNFRVKKNYSG
jgi:hypothetical protein